MLKTRVIPCLLLKGNGLVKSIKFKDYKYIGDPINAVKIFSEKQVPEIIFLNIDVDKPNLKIIQDIADEAYVPFTYGGGIKSIEDIRNVLNSGAEKVSINRYANKEFVRSAAETFGSQCIIASIDDDNIKQAVKKAIEMEQAGAGEILLTSIEQDGTMQGYNLELIKEVSSAVNIPVIACGGAGTKLDFKKAISAGAHAVGAGSMFVYQGKLKSVLINYDM